MASITEFDAFLFGEGTHRQAYDKLGAHPTCEAGRNGVRFAVWAPSAAQVSAVGVFNNWQPGANPLQPAGVSGIWEGFVPEPRLGRSTNSRFVREIQISGSKKQTHTPGRLRCGPTRLQS